jgi:MoaA/NifB/PqqE/SkfB family radical SAM enzyme
MYPEIWKIQLDRINELNKGVSKVNPVRLRIRLTNRCNLSCIFCIRNTFTKEKLDSTKEVSRKKLLNLIDDFANLGGKFVEITGDGEPCVKLETLLAVMQRIKKRNLFGELTTNGTLFTEDSIREIINMRWDVLRFSIDGKKETNDFLRGQNGAFDKAIKNLSLFKEIKNKNNIDEPKLTINFILTNKNYNQIQDMVKILKDAEGSYLWITPMILQIDSAKKLLLNKKQKELFVKSLDRLIKLSKEYNVNTNLSDFYHIYSEVIPNDRECKGKKIDKEDESGNNDKKIIKEENTKNKDYKFRNTKCFMPWSDIIVAEDGRVGPCLAFYFNENIKDNSLKKIWYGKSFEKIRDLILKNNLGMYCKDCRQWWGPEEANLLKSQLEDHDLNKTFNNLIKKKKYDKAIEYLKKRLKDYSKPQVIYRNIGECYIKREDYDSTLLYLNKAKKIEPKLEWLNFSIGKTYFLMKEYENAEKFLKKNLSIKGQNPSSYENSKLLLSKIKKIKKK